MTDNEITAIKNLRAAAWHVYLDIKQILANNRGGTDRPEYEYRQLRGLACHEAIHELLAALLSFQMNAPKEVLP